MMIGTALRARICRQTSVPESFGSSRSSSTRSNACESAASTACSPSRATATSKRSRSSAYLSVSTRGSSSSTTRTRGLIAPASCLGADGGLARGDVAPQDRERLGWPAVGLERVGELPGRLDEVRAARPLEELDGQLEQLDRAAAVAVLGEDVADQDVGTALIPGLEGLDLRERMRRRSRGFLEAVEREQRTRFLERELRVLAWGHLAAEGRPAVPELLEGRRRIPRLDLGVREQVVCHRDVRIVLGPLQDLERAPRVPRPQLGILVVRVQARLCPEDPCCREGVVHLLAATDRGREDLLGRAAAPAASTVPDPLEAIAAEVWAGGSGGRGHCRGRAESGPVPAADGGPRHRGGGAGRSRNTNTARDAAGGGPTTTEAGGHEAGEYRPLRRPAAAGRPGRTGTVRFLAMAT